MFAWRWRAPTLLAAWLCAAALWAAVRHLKHAGRLSDAEAPVPAPKAPVGDVAA
jgi:hypothetical protein